MSVHPPGVVTLGNDSLPAFVELPDLNPTRDCDIGVDIEGQTSSAVHIVAVTIELQRTTYHPGHPLWVTLESTVVAIAGRIAGDGPGTLIELPPADKSRVSAFGYARHNQSKRQNKRT
ncbi:hypothetical protein ES703_68632 [subsurface metagenome]